MVQKRECQEQYKKGGSKISAQRFWEIEPIQLADIAG
jgi:hypothetical protein